MSKQKLLLAGLTLALVAGVGAFAVNGNLLQGAMGRSNALAISLDSSVSSGAVTAGADETILKFQMKCASRSACLVKNMKFKGSLDDSGTANVLAQTQAQTVHGTELADYVLAAEVVDSTGTAVTAQESVSGFDVTFTDTLNIPARSTATYTLKVKMAPTLNADGDAEQFAFSLNSTSVRATEANGTALPVLGKVNPPVGMPAVVFTTSNAGTLTFSSYLVGDENQAQIVVAGTQGNQMGQFRFVAQRENYKVQQLTLTNANGGQTGDYDDNIQTLSVTYYTDEAQTQADSTTCSLSAAETFVCAFATGHEMIVPDADAAGLPNYATLTVEADLESISNGADSGDQPQLTLDAELDFLAEGQTSGTVLTDGGTDAEANPRYVAATDLDFSNSSSFTGSNVSVAATEEVMAFTAVTHPNEDAVLKSLTFAIDLNEAFSAGIVDEQAVADTNFYLQINRTTVADEVAADQIGSFDAAKGTFTVTFDEFIDDPTLSGTDTISLLMDLNQFVDEDTSETELLVISVEEGALDAPQGVIWNDYYADVNFTGSSKTEKVQVTSSL